MECSSFIQMYVFCICTLLVYEYVFPVYVLSKYTVLKKSDVFRS